MNFSIRTTYGRIPKVMAKGNAENKRALDEDQLAPKSSQVIVEVGFGAVRISQ